MATISAKLDSNLQERLNKYAIDNDADKSKIIRRAIREFLDKVEKKELPKKNK